MSAESYTTAQEQTFCDRRSGPNPEMAPHYQLVGGRE
jgi:hypothetical protein